MNHCSIGGRNPAQNRLALACTLSVFCINLPFIHPAFAQSTPEKTSETILVTASRLPQHASDVLSDNHIITADQIAQSGQSTLAELLQKVRGIEITSNGGAGANSSVFIRGTDNKQSIVLVDGVRIGSSTLGGATWSSIPLSQIDHVEIVYGPLSSMYGADAMGGVIQVFTKKGSVHTSPAASVGFGSYGTRIAEASISGAGIDGKVRYALRAGHEESDGFSATKPGAYSYNDDKDGHEKNSASGRLSVDVAKGHELGATFMQSRLNAQSDGGADYDDRVIGKLQNFSAYSTNRFTSEWKSHLQASHTADKNTNDAAYGVSQYDSTQTNLTWQNDFSIGKDQLQLVLERRKEDVDSTDAELVRDRHTNSVALAYLLKRGVHLATVSVRNDKNAQFGSVTTGNLGYGYRITRGLRANVSVGTSFRAPTFNELYYPSYGIATNKPERGRNAEAGLYFDDGQSQFSAVYFHNKITDLLVYAPVCPVEQASHPYGCAYNINQALLSGLSLGGSTSYERFTLRGSLDFQNPRDQTADKLLARRAKRHGSVALEYTSNNVKGGVEMIFSGRRFNDTGNMQTLGGYGVLNIYGSYALNADWSLFGRWNNAFDKNYELTKDYATAGSNLFVGIRYGLK